MSKTASGSSQSQTQSYTNMPDARGHFGVYGGMFVSETLMGALDELREAYEQYLKDPDFLRELDEDLKHYVGRPSPLYFAERWTQRLGGAQIFLKREDLNHTGAHKVNNTIGQALLAKRMGKTRIIRHCGRPFGAGVRGVHGLGRHQAPGHQRLPHEAIGCQGNACGIRLQDLERRHERSHA